MVIDFSKASGVTFPFLLGDASTYTVGRVPFQVKGAGTYSFVPAIKVRNSQGQLVAADLQNVFYTNRLTGATVTAGTAITAAGIYEVDTTGVEVWITGSYTSGACILVTNPMLG